MPVIDFKTPIFRVHVYVTPQKLSDGYCFAEGVPITFLNVDWFDSPADRAALEKFIRGKRYFNPGLRFLVVGDHPDLTFTIDPP